MEIKLKLPNNIQSISITIATDDGLHSVWHNDIISFLDMQDGKIFDYSFVNWDNLNKAR